MKLSGNYSVRDLINIVTENSAEYFGMLGDAVQSPEKVSNFLSAVLHNPEKESFGVLFLDNRHHILCYREMFTGTVDMAAVYPREIFKAAFMCNASAMIIAHNHPGGSLRPSPDDQQITQEIKDGCQVLGLRLLDHVIVGDGTYSFREHGDL